MAFMCPYCDSSFRTMTELFKHCKLKHSYSFYRSVTCRQLGCLRLMNNFYSLKKHIIQKHKSILNDDNVNVTIIKPMCMETSSNDGEIDERILNSATSSCSPEGTSESQKITLDFLKNSMHNAHRTILFHFSQNFIQIRTFQSQSYKA